MLPDSSVSSLTAEAAPNGSPAAASSSDYDSPWKEALEQYLPEAIAIFAPRLHTRVDWRQPAQVLDKEFQALGPGSRQRRRQVDKLVRLVLLPGLGADYVYLLLHVEIQGGRISSAGLKRLALRVQQYDYRIHDRYVLQPALDGQQEDPECTVYTLVVLTHSADGPSHLIARHQALQGAQELRYHVEHLAAWPARWNELEALARGNPFAVVIQAQLLAQHYRSRERFEPKLSLVRQLRDHGYRREDVVSLLRLIDWIIQLPAGLEEPYARAVEQVREESVVAYVTSFERVGERRGIAIGVEIGVEQGRRQTFHEILKEQLSAKFGVLPPETLTRLDRADIEQLRGWALRIVRAESLTEVFEGTA